MDNCDVIIVNYNAGPFLARCAASLPDLGSQVIVVDNASRDDSLELLDRAPGVRERVRVIRNEENVGFAAACNIGIAVSSAPYLLFVNPDCVLQPGSLERMLNVLQRDPGVGMVGGLLLDPDGKEQAGGRRAIPTPWRSFVRGFGLTRFSASYPKLLFDFHLNERELPRAPVEVEAISGALMLVRREAMNAVGPWDEGYFLHCEDLDWCVRFRRNGWRILFVPDAPVVHDKGVCSRSRPVFVEWHKHRGMLRFFRKFFRANYPPGLFLLVSIAVWLRFTIVVLKIQATRPMRARRAVRV